MTRPELLTSGFRALSARLGKDPLQVQGPGGNTSIKDDGVMWIKASGTELADAGERNIFVPVDLVAARSGKTAPDPTSGLRPSIETAFHASLDHRIVVHTHSISTLTHAISPEGLHSLAAKLDGLPFAIVPYAKPGVPLTGEIMARVNPDTSVIILQNHGLVCCGADVAEVDTLLAEVESRLQLPVRETAHAPPLAPALHGYRWSEHGWLACDHRSAALARQGSYYPDHVVFLGPGLPTSRIGEVPPVILAEGEGVQVRTDATTSQLAMLRCLSDILLRLPDDWTACPIGPDAEAELLNWDLEKYRQKMAGRN